MINALIGQKIDQTQKFLENGKRIPVTQINVSDNAVLQVKTGEYTAVQLGFGVKKKPTKASIGHSKKAGFDKASQYIREVRLQDTDALPTAGEYITVETVFQPGDVVAVTGTSKGKGFAGVVKRHHFRGGPKTHGQSDRHRAPGSIGQSTTPGRVYKGKRMAGRMGSDTVTLQNLTVVDVDAENKKLYVSGLVPGHKDALVLITKTGERKKFVPLLGAKKEEAEVAAETTVEAEVQVESPAEEVKEEEVTKPVEEKQESSSAKATEDKEVKEAEPEEKGIKLEASEGQDAVEEAPKEEKKEEEK